MIINRGIAGDTTKYLKKRFYVDAVQLKPKYCILGIGINDSIELEGDYWKKLEPVPYSEKLKIVKSNIIEIIQQAKKEKIMLILTSLLPINIPILRYERDRKMYIKELKNLAKEENILANIEVTDISKFPDVLTIKSNSDDETIKNELLNTVNNAIDNLVNMRKQEGEKISCDLLQRLEYVENKTMEISAKSTGLIEEYVVKLEERIKELLKTEEIDKTRIAQEVVIYADKCSVQEEVTRLKSHIGQFRNLINTDQAVGKKLDFLIQEMNRETNTIGSKANNLEITNNVIDIKTELENIREQIQNIE